MYTSLVEVSEALVASEWLMKGWDFPCVFVSLIHALGSVSSNNFAYF